MPINGFHKKTLIGDAYSNSARGGYVFEFEVPRYKWAPTEENGDLLRRYAMEMLSTAMAEIGSDANRYGVTLDEYMATLAYEIQCDGTDEDNRDGSPAWSQGRSDIPLFNKQRRSINLSMMEFADRMAALGENDTIAAIADQQVATKYENKYMRPRKVYIRSHTEELATLVSEFDVVASFMRDAPVYSEQFKERVKRRQRISKRKLKEQAEKEARELRNRKRREKYQAKKEAEAAEQRRIEAEKLARAKRRKAASQKPVKSKVASQKPVEKRVKDAAGRTVGTWKRTAAGWRYLKAGKWTTPTPLAMKRKPKD